MVWFHKFELVCGKRQEGREGECMTAVWADGVAVKPFVDARETVFGQ